MNRKIITINGVEFYQIGYAGGEQYYYQQGLDPNPDQLITVDFAMYKETPDTRSYIQKIQQDGEHFKIESGVEFWKYNNRFYHIEANDWTILDKRTVLRLYSEYITD